MSSQGRLPRVGAADAWWYAVYQGPRDTVPDTPLAQPGGGSVDDWFDSVRDVIGEQPEDGPAQDPWVLPGGSQAPPAPGYPQVAEPASPGHAMTVTHPSEPVAPEGSAVDAPPPCALGADTPEADAEPAATALPVSPANSRLVMAGEPSGLETAPQAPYVGDRPPTYDAEPSALPPADPDVLAQVVPDTVLEGAHYGSLTLRAAGVRGDSARYRGEPRRDALLVARFGEGPDGVVIAAVAGAARNAAPQPAAAAEACRRLAAAVARSRAEVLDDLRSGARDHLRFGLQRLATRAVRHLLPADPGPDPAAAPPDAVLPHGQDAPEAGSLHCLVAPLDPSITQRACFGVGPGGLFLLRSAHWIDAYAARLLHHPDEPPAPDDAPAAAFHFRLVTATAGDVLLLATAGLADPVRQEPSVAGFLTEYWSAPQAPGTVDFLRQIQVRVKGYADDRTAVALWTG